ncbi:MAG: ROK family transcriptional regulator [Spirochaetes bacterium]|nr:ROK family transcriptional regulator [Spirochaetota bacterium]
MTPRGFNAPDIHRRNRAGILRLVHRHGEIARNDLARALGLTRAAVTILANELIDEGTIVEAGSPDATGKAGRRKIFLRIRPESGMALGIGADAERLQVLLSDLAGAVLGERTLPSPATPGADGAAAAEKLASNVAGAVSDLLGGRTASDAGVIGAGLGVTGWVDSGTGTSLREPRLWEGPVALREPLERALGIPVAVDNNVRALALAEFLFADTHSSAPSGLLFVKYGPGVGAAWAAGGIPWPGAHHRSGELGHTLVEGDGPPCPYCGRHGCLESLISARALGERLGRPGARIEELCAELERVDPSAFAQLAERFARALGNAIELYDPAVVALYGSPFRQGNLLVEIARRVESNERPCEIRRSGLDPDLPALGGVALAFERFFLDAGSDAHRQ